MRVPRALAFHSKTFEDQIDYCLEFRYSCGSPLVCDIRRGHINTDRLRNRIQTKTEYFILTRLVCSVPSYHHPTSTVNHTSGNSLKVFISFSFQLPLSYIKTTWVNEMFSHQSAEKVVIIATSQVNVFDVLDDDFRSQRSAAIENDKLSSVPVDRF